MKSKKIKAAILAPAFLFSVGSLLACGPWFPNNMLDRGDAAVLVAPVANFYHELDRMSLAPPKFRAVPSTNSYADEALQAEISDLRAALKKSGKSADETERIVTNHLAERGKLQEFQEAFETWKASAPIDWEHRGELIGPKPQFPSIAAVDGLPGEFADYFEGTIFWNNPDETDKAAARESWERLLKRPKEDRGFKSTWAAFMLGRAWETEDPNKAGNYYKQVRDLAAHGFADSAGLAVASFGQEARLALRTNDFQNAIELYLTQYAANDSGAAVSLQVAVGRALRAGPNTLESLALHPTTRRLITAYLVSHQPYDESPSASVHGNTRAWLEAVEKAGVTDVESAEEFALAAYQANEMGLALRWVKRAGDSPTAQWLQAKLLLRAGRVTQATELLSRIVDSFPVSQETNATDGAEPSFAERLVVRDATENDPVPAGRYIRGELGALRLSRREYTQALDLLLRADFWTDAAYVADRVLTVDELKTYVDDNWPAITKTNEDNQTEVEKNSERLTSEIRYLLARRLTRNSRGPDARAYFPAEQLPALDQLLEALNAGWDESLAAGERAKALAAAAFIARTNGMDLLATEIAPDWHIEEGSFDSRFSADARTNKDVKVVFASKDELKRNEESKTDPDKRYHYRYQAAALAWEAAKLMPNNSDDTARLLCDAGSWLKAQDPLAADLFYKTLVRRCRKTAIGAEADEVRWFPQFDADGNLIRIRLETLDLPTSQEISSAEAISTYPIPGKHFLVQDGDHVRNIVSAVRRLGMDITAKEIFAANPDITPDDYIAGREIFIPLPAATSTEATPPPSEEISPEN